MIRKLNHKLKVVAFARIAGILCAIAAMRPAEDEMEYAIVGNESFSKTSKFELDLYSGHSDMSKVWEVIWIDVASDNVAKLSNGHYTYSSDGIADRSAFNFFGTFTRSGKKAKIKSGSFDVMISKEMIDVVYDLGLDNGTQLKGHYKGKYQLADWRQKITKL